MKAIQSERQLRNYFNGCGFRYEQGIRERAAEGLALEQELGWLPRLSKVQVLDLGCGPGTYSSELKRRAKLLIGFDLSEAMLELARKRCRLDLVHGNAEQLPFAAATFDLVFCAFCFANLPSPARMIREISRILRPQGFLAIMDVVAPAQRPNERDQVNQLERARSRCRTRILDSAQFRKLLDVFPFQWKNRSFRSCSIGFRDWVAASCLRRGTVEFLRARSAFQRAAAAQQAGHAGNAECRYAYSVGQFLLQKMPAI